MQDTLRATWFRTLPTGQRDEFDGFVERARGGHFAQSRRWLDCAISGRSVTPRYVMVRTQGGELVATALLLRGERWGVPTFRGVIERGPVVDRVELMERVLAAIVLEARRHGVVDVRAMPYWGGVDGETAGRAMVRAGFACVQTLDGPHATTTRLVLAGKTRENVFDGGERKKLRYELKNAKKLGAQVSRKGRDGVFVLEELSRAMMSAQGDEAKPPAWFRTVGDFVENHREHGAIFVCEEQGEPLAAVLVVRHGSRVTFVSGASIPEPRPFSKMALPLAEAVYWALDLGCESFDFGGVPLPEDTDEKRLAIMRFKLDFGKERTCLVREHRRIG